MFTERAEIDWLTGIGNKNSFWTHEIRSLIEAELRQRIQNCVDHSDSKTNGHDPNEGHKDTPEGHVMV